MEEDDTPTQKTRRAGGSSCVDASQSGRTSERLPMTPESQVMTRSRKRRRSPSLSDSQRDIKENKVRVLEPLPPSVLLLSLPKLFAVPPNHKAHIASFVLSLNALRKCSAMRNLPPDVECRAWTNLAEVGLKIVRAGWSRDEQFPWAADLENEARILYYCSQCQSLNKTCFRSKMPSAKDSSLRRRPRLWLSTNKLLPFCKHASSICKTTQSAHVRPSNALPLPSPFPQVRRLSKWPALHRGSCTPLTSPRSHTRYQLVRRI